MKKLSCSRPSKLSFWNGLKIPILWLTYFIMLKSKWTFIFLMEKAFFVFFALRRDMKLQSLFCKVYLKYLNEGHWDISDKLYKTTTAISCHAVTQKSKESFFHCCLCETWMFNPYRLSKWLVNSLKTTLTDPSNATFVTYSLTLSLRMYHIWYIVVFSSYLS